MGKYDKAALLELILAGIILIVILIAMLLILSVLGKTRETAFLSHSKENVNITFPKHFLWGSATASQQIEHWQNTDWSAFVKKSLSEKYDNTDNKDTQEAAYVEGIAQFPEHIIRKTANFDERYKDDLQTAAKMGHNAFRFSFCWARLFPSAGMHSPCQKGVDFYQKILDSMKSNHLKPCATIFHFSSPLWFWEADAQGKRGWERDDALHHFEIYVSALITHFGSQIDFWCTLNEPTTYVYLGYIDGRFPPNEKRTDMKQTGYIIATLVRAHALCYRLLKKHAKAHNRDIQVGYTKHIRLFEPYHNHNPLDRITATKIEQSFIWDWMDAIHSGILKVTGTNLKIAIPEAQHTIDYIGVNYYGRFYIKSHLFSPTHYEVLENDPNDGQEEVNDIGWCLYPLGFRTSLQHIAKRYGQLPIYVLENGVADHADDDKIRQALLWTHLRELGLAIQEDGLDVRGYFHWALTDNFEWTSGFDACFGLMSVDYKHNFRRTPRPSAKIFSSIISSGITKESWQAAKAKYKIID